MMIVADNVSKAYAGKKSLNQVLDRLSFEMPEGGHLAILGRQGSGKSTVLNLIGGLEQPDTGKIRRFGTVSWVAGRMRFERGMTIGQNIRFLARIVGQKHFAAIEDRVREIGGFGSQMRETFDELNDADRKILTYATLLAFDFDIMLFEGTPFGRPGIKEKLDPLLEEKMQQSMAVTTVSKPADISDLYTHILVLADQTGRLYENRNEAVKAFKDTGAED